MARRNSRSEAGAGSASGSLFEAVGDVVSGEPAIPGAVDARPDSVGEAPQQTYVSWAELDSRIAAIYRAYGLRNRR